MADPQGSAAIEPAPATRTTTPLPVLMLGAIGVVYGDIGTSPLYAMKETFIGPHPLNLVFSVGGIGLMFLAVLIGSLVASGGSGNWYKGAQLIGVYLMIALLLYFVPL